MERDCSPSWSMTLSSGRIGRNTIRLPSGRTASRTSTWDLARGAEPQISAYATYPLSDALLVLYECETHVAVARFAESDTGRNRDLRFLDEELRELERSHRFELIGDRSPGEHR